MQLLITFHAYNLYVCGLRMLLNYSSRSIKKAFYHYKPLGNKYKDANLEVSISLK